MSKRALRTRPSSSSSGFLFRAAYRRDAGAAQYSFADFNPSEGMLTIHHSSQAPQMMARIASLHFGLADHKVRVVCKDVGGSFGIKIHIYPDEMAAIALSIKLGRAVKFVADRLGSFVSIFMHASIACAGRTGLSASGEIVALEIDDRTGIGPYSMYPRTSAVEANQVLNITGGPIASPITADAPASLSRTRHRRANIAPSAIRSPAPSRKA